MTPARNPYPRREGFGLRVLRSKSLIARYGDSGKSPWCRSFDNCFEMDDGDAVVWALVHTALREDREGKPNLKRGIEMMRCWDQWLAVYEAQHLAEQTALPL